MIVVAAFLAGHGRSWALARILPTAVIAAMALGGRRHAPFAGVSAALLDCRHHERMGLGGSGLFLGMSRKNADHWRTEDHGVIDPLFEGGDLRESFFARWMAEIISHRGAGNI